MAKSNDVDKILESLRQLREADERMREQAREEHKLIRQEMREADEQLRKRIETLTGTVGNYHGEILEPAAATYVMRKLESKGYRFKDVLEARFIPMNGTMREFDLYGVARRDGADWLVVGEVKRNPTIGDLERFDADTRGLVRRRRGHVVRVFFCIGIQRKIRREAGRRNIFVITHRRPRGR